MNEYLLLMFNVPLTVHSKIRWNDHVDLTRRSHRSNWLRKIQDFPCFCNSSDVIGQNNLCIGYKSKLSLDRINLT